MVRAAPSLWNMHLTRYTDYALRALLYVGAHPGQLVPASTIASAYGISADHVAKATKALTRAGLLRAARGAAGGVELAQPPSRIRVGAVVRLLEGDRPMAECFDAENNQCPIAGVCRLERALAKARSAFYASLDACTLEDLLKNRAELTERLLPEQNLVASSRRR
jgi:Rrf2 family nitric oxide-sensitive transcriptional repressor